MSEHEPQPPRRSHPHRGRRGHDRRGGGNRRPQAPQPQDARRDQLDVEQLMREIRARVSGEHGIILSNQQIQDLAGRRLEAILDPHTLKPSLLDQLRRSAGIVVPETPPAAETAVRFDEAALHASPSGLVRLLRTLLRPLARLLVNLQPLVDAITRQERLNVEAAAREAEERRRQAEWNSLHFEILRRVVLDIARADIERQELTMRVESLSTKVDFNERRVRAIEQAQLTARPAPRSAEQPVAVPVGGGEGGQPEGSVTESGDASRRRRRRRRGRRPGTAPVFDAGAPAEGPSVEQAEPTSGTAAPESDQASPDPAAPAQMSLPTPEPADFPSSSSASDESRPDADERRGPPDAVPAVTADGATDPTPDR